MGKPPFWVLLLSLLLVPLVSCEQQEVRNSLLAFLRTLSDEDRRVEHDLGWNTSTDPCDPRDGWQGITCDNRNSTKWVVILGRHLRGSIDAGHLCRAPSLIGISISGNSLRGGIPREISQCTNLTHLLLPGNGLSGNLPSSLAALNNLKRLDISNNSFSGELPGIARISCLVSFLAQHNDLAGAIPQFQFDNLNDFNVSHNSFSGPLPAGANRFSFSSFVGNPGLCGEPIFPPCPPPPEGKPRKWPSRKKLVMYLGYVLFGVALLVFSAYELTRKQRKKKKIVKTAEAAAGKKGHGQNKVPNESGTGKKSPASTGSGVHGARENRSEYSIPSSEATAAMLSSSLIVLKNPTAKELRLQDLLTAPAELLGRGRHGSVYRVVLGDGTTVAVRRIKDEGVPAEEFRRRMERMNQARHPNVLPALAFYCANQEKLVVYDYLPNGSLFNLLHGPGRRNGRALDWASRLTIAAGISDGLAFMHQELHTDGISHGNIKSSNILMDAHMHPCVSEFGLSAADGSGEPGAGDPFTADIRGFGVILLELLTGKVVEGSGLDLARWVESVVREEWTAEVFDGELTGDGASEARMLSLLQVALKCISPSPDAQPGMKQVAAIVSSILDAEERSMQASETSESR